MTTDLLRTADLVSPRKIGVVHHKLPVTGLADETLPSTHGHGIVAVRFGFQLEPRLRRARFVAAFLRVRFDDPGIMTDNLWIVQGLATGSVAGSVTALSDGSPGWLFGDPRLNVPIPAVNAADALLEVPAALTELAGTIRLDVTMTASGLPGTRRDHGRSESASRFTVALPADWAVPARPLRTQSTPAKLDHSDHARPAVRLCVAADIERFSRFQAPEAARAQRRLVNLLEAARQTAGIASQDVILQESGDGQFAVLPPGIDESVVLPRLVEGLRETLRETNADLNDRARLRLRVALYRGHVTPGANGWVGAATIAVHRLLDSDVLRQALVSAPAADFALIVPDVLYQEIVLPRYGTLDPDRFTEVHAAVPAKDFAERAWIHIPH